MKMLSVLVVLNVVLLTLGPPVFAGAELEAPAVVALPPFLVHGDTLHGWWSRLICLDRYPSANVTPDSHALGVGGCGRFVRWELIPAKELDSHAVRS